MSECREGQAGEPKIPWRLAGLGETLNFLVSIGGSSKGIEQENDVTCLNLKFQEH